MSIFDKSDDRNWTWNIWFVIHMSLLLATIMCAGMHVTEPNLDLPVQQSQSTDIGLW